MSGAGESPDPVRVLIEAALGEFNRAFRDPDVDPDALAARYWHPEGELVPRYAALEGRSFRGHAGVAAFIRESRRLWEAFDPRWELEGIHGEGERRVAVYTIHIRTQDTRIGAEQRLGAEIELRDGKVYRLVVHPDPKEALRAGGLDPALAS